MRLLPIFLFPVTILWSCEGSGQRAEVRAPFDAGSGDADSDTDSGTGAEPWVCRDPGAAGAAWSDFCARRAEAYRRALSACCGTLPGGYAPEVYSDHAEMVCLCMAFGGFDTDRMYADPIALDHCYDVETSNFDDCAFADPSDLLAACWND